jgi:hypothetical protein
MLSTASCRRHGCEKAISLDLKRRPFARRPSRWNQAGEGAPTYGALYVRVISVETTADPVLTADKGEVIEHGSLKQ